MTLAPAPVAASVSRFVLFCFVLIVTTFLLYLHAHLLSLYFYLVFSIDDTCTRT